MLPGRIVACDSAAGGAKPGPSPQRKRRARWPEGRRSRPARRVRHRSVILYPEEAHLSMPVKPVPEGYRTVTPYLFVDDGPAALEFYETVFGAVERMRMDWGEDKIGHAEFEIGDSLVMLASEFPELSALSPKSVGGTPVAIALHVEDADAVFSRAVREGAEVIRPVENQFFGDRSGVFRDPFGHQWSVSTHVEDVSPEEMERRSREILARSDSSGS